MKIEFGCGNKKPLNGFVGSDLVKNKHVKFVCPAWEITKFVKEETVEEIYSRFMFEHLTFPQGKLTLERWYKILTPNGRVRLILPDLRYHCLQIVNNNKKFANRFKYAQTGIYGWQRENWGDKNFTAINKTWDVHKSGYDFNSFRHLVEICNYKNIKRLSNEAHLDIEFFK